MNKPKKEIKTFAVDFDGTCVGFDFPRVGKDIGAELVLKDLVAAGHRIVLNTMRSDKENPVSSDPEIITPKDGSECNYLSQAVMWFKTHDIPLYGVNVNPEQYSWTDSPKVYADFYIDDISLGCPLISDPNVSFRAFVDWRAMRAILKSKNLL